MVIFVQVFTNRPGQVMKRAVKNINFHDFQWVSMQNRTSEIATTMPEWQYVVIKINSSVYLCNLWSMCYVFDSIQVVAHWMVMENSERVFFFPNSRRVKQVKCLWRYERERERERKGKRKINTLHRFVNHSLGERERERHIYIVTILCIHTSPILNLKNSFAGTIYLI